MNPNFCWCSHDSNTHRVKRGLTATTMMSNKFLNEYEDKKEPILHHDRAGTASQHSGESRTGSSALGCVDDGELDIQGGADDLVWLPIGEPDGKSIRSSIVSAITVNCTTASSNSSTA